MATDKLTDEAVQAALDAGEALAADRDVAAYQRVYGALARSDASLPSNFAYRVVQVLVRQRLAQGGSAATLVSFLVTAAALLGGCAMMATMIALGYGEGVNLPDLGTLQALSPVWVLVALVMVLLGLFDTIYGHRQSER